MAHELKNLSLVQTSTNWSLENGYDGQNQNNESYPYRAFGFRNLYGITVLTESQNPAVDYLCSGGFDGFSITIHLPNELPTIGKNTYYISAYTQNEGSFWVAPNLIATSPALRDYDPHVRQCFFDSERKLRFYRQYTQLNCESECLANYTLDKCACAHFAMPSKAANLRLVLHPNRNYLWTFSCVCFLNVIFRNEQYENLWTTKVRLHIECGKKSSDHWCDWSMQLLTTLPCAHLRDYFWLQSIFYAWQVL